MANLFANCFKSHNCVVIFENIFDKREARINQVSILLFKKRRKKVNFLYEMFELFHKHCFFNAILAGVSVDHFCLLSNQQDKTFLQNVFLINPRPLKYLTDKSDEKQHTFLPSLDIIAVGICFHFSSFFFFSFFPKTAKKIFASHLR